MTHRLTFERMYPYPPERVWRALTDPRSLAAWLMDNDFAPIVGHRFHFRAAPTLGFNGIVSCEVIAVEAPRRLAYTWQGGPLRRPTVVTWTLEPVAQGIRLRLEQTGFAGPAGRAVGFLLGRGWRGLLDRELPQTLARPDGA